METKQVVVESYLDEKHNKKITKLFGKISYNYEEANKVYKNYQSKNSIELLNKYYSKIMLVSLYSEELTLYTQRFSKVLYPMLNRPIKKHNEETCKDCIKETTTNNIKENSNVSSLDKSKSKSQTKQKDIESTSVKSASIVSNNITITEDIKNTPIDIVKEEELESLPTKTQPIIKELSNTDTIKSVINKIHKDSPKFRAKTKRAEDLNAYVSEMNTTNKNFLIRQVEFFEEVIYPKRQELLKDPQYKDTKPNHRAIMDILCKLIREELDPDTNITRYFEEIEVLKQLKDSNYLDSGLNLCLNKWKELSDKDLKEFKRKILPIKRTNKSVK